MRPVKRVLNHSVRTFDICSPMCEFWRLKYHIHCLLFCNCPVLLVQVELFTGRLVVTRVSAIGSGPHHKQDASKAFLNVVISHATRNKCENATPNPKVGRYIRADHQRDTQADNLFPSFTYRKDQMGRLQNLFSFHKP